MSYSVSVEPSTKGQFPAELAEAKSKAIALAAPEFQGAIGDHFDMLAQAVEPLLRALGRDSDLVSLHISGHANPGHAPTDGWANEALSLSFGVIPQDAPADPVTVTEDGPEASTGSADASPSAPAEQPAGDGQPTS